MSYDLGFFVPAGGRVPSHAGLMEYFRSRPWYQIQGTQAFYGNEDTGVYFSFELDAETTPDENGIGLSFNVNYVRPSVFGLEAEGEVAAVVARFGLSVDDPQMGGMGRGAYSAAGFLSGWNAGNAFGYQAIVAQIRSHPGKEDDFFSTVLPSAELERCWRWNMQRAELQERLGDGVFVPRISFLRREGGIRSFVVWGDAMAIALPDVDTLALVRQQLAPRRFFFFRPQDAALAPFADLGPLLTLGQQASSPVPHRLFLHETPPAALVAFFQSQKASRLGQVGVPLDKILDAELIQQALNAPPLEEMQFEDPEP